MSTPPPAPKRRRSLRIRLRDWLLAPSAEEIAAAEAHAAGMLAVLRSMGFVQVSPPEPPRDDAERGALH